MKNPRRNPFLVLSVLLSASLPLYAVEVVKDLNTNDLFSGTSWVGGTAPGSGDVSVWNNTLTGANSASLGTTTGWAGIKIVNPGGNVGINVATGRALSVGTSGIDMSTATADLSIGGNGLIRPTTGSTSSYNVPTGRALTINATFQATSNTTTVNFNGAGTVNINKLGGTPASPTSLILSNNGTGTVNYGGSVTSGVFQINATGNGSSVVVNGPSLTASQASFIGSGTSAAGKMELQSGSLNYNSGVSLANMDGSLLKVSGGTFTATNISMGRTSNVGEVPDAPLTSGFVVTGGTAALTGNLTIGTSNSSATARVDGGALSIAGTAIVGQTTNTRWSKLQVSSGSLTITGSSGVQLSTNTATANNSQFILKGGTTTTEAIRYGVATSTAGSRGDVIVNSGATLYVGSGGASIISGNAYTANFNVNGGTVGAKANWTSSVGIALTGNSTFKAADAADTSFNIAINGQVTGTGGFTKTGAGRISHTTWQKFSEILTSSFV